MNPEVQAKGAKALAKWRKERAKAYAKGGVTLERWTKKEADKKAMKNYTPTIAIKKHCLNCSNDQISEITNCTVTSCAIYPVRPFK
jgi:hypothetical protein